jgi:GTP-binding protein Era
VIIVVNKIDQIKDKAQLLPFLTQLAGEGEFAAIVPVSATRGAQLDACSPKRASICRTTSCCFRRGRDHRPQRALPRRRVHSRKALSPDRRRVALCRCRRDREVRRRWRLRRISAAIVVDRAGHKSIVIGKGGEVVKRIASEARQDMERMFGGPVFLEVFVKVKSGWADDERLLKSLGYE